mgnify:CR=1 FL=1
MIKLGDYVSRKSYNNDVMMCLVNAIRSLEPLEVNLETLNENISVFERIAEALEEQNELKKIELGIESKTNIQRRR